MSILDEISKVKAEFPTTTPNAAELQRLGRFLAEMKRAGVARTQEYNIPQPDTIGYVLVNTPSKGTR
ncbi:MAG: hypothetical protein V1792_04980 [Pseudomonadota bacterium]